MKKICLQIFFALGSCLSLAQTPVQINLSHLQSDCIYTGTVFYYYTIDSTQYQDRIELEGSFDPKFVSYKPDFGSIYQQTLYGYIPTIHNISELAIQVDLQSSCEDDFIRDIYYKKIEIAQKSTFLKIVFRKKS